MKKRLGFREFRKKVGLTLEEVAQRSGIPYSTVRALEIGLGSNFSFDIKNRVAHILGEEVFKLFPEEQERFNAMMKRRHHRPCHHRLATLLDFLPDLEFQDENVVEKILIAMTLEETADIFHSALSEGEAIKDLGKYAKKYGFEPPRVK